MRFWPFGRRPAAAPPAGSSGFTVAELGPQLAGVLAVGEVRADGHAVAFGGRLLLPPRAALDALMPRFRSFGYTPFLQAGEGLTWIRAVPFVDVVVASRIWPNVVFFLVTCITTLIAGWAYTGSPTFDALREQRGFGQLFAGLPFAGTLMAVLVVHEFGHYFAARYHGASVSLPYFIPAPPLFGTFGALIRMRSTVRDRNSLFDIAAAGPLAGLAVALPAMILGLGWSTTVSAPPPGSEALRFGDSLLLTLLKVIWVGSMPEGSVLWTHPVADAAWAGLFVTALNLVPVGQLDGGRIAYALFGARHRQVSIATFCALLALGFITGSNNWFVWAFLLFFVMGFQHQPPLDDLSPLSPGRYAVGVACLVLLVLLIPPVPIAIQ
jgi:membrane-associated protease RseP (regulator of RpoE activity)